MTDDGLLTKGDVEENDMVGEEYSGKFCDGHVIARADGVHYLKGWRDDKALLEFGSCDDCDIDVVSWAKHARCPNCGDALYLT